MHATILSYSSKINMKSDKVGDVKFYLSRKGKNSFEEIKQGT